MSADQPRRWDALPHSTPNDDEVRAKLDSIPDGDPMHVAMAFIFALSELNRTVLESLTNPESRPAWGDYRETHDVLVGFGDWGIGSQPEYLEERGARLAYVKILRDVDESMVATEDTIVMAAAILTLVKRPDINNSWFVQAIGDYWHPAAE